jgi:hydroxymethylbilane synthase
MDGTLLALAGLKRLNFRITDDGRLLGDAVPEGLFATLLDVDVMLPCVGQAAVGIEIREHDERIETLCARLNHYNTHQCVTAERAFLSAMGGGCQSPVGAYAEVVQDQLRLRAVSFLQGCRRAEAKRSLKEPVELGNEVAAQLR